MSKDLATDIAAQLRKQLSKVSRDTGENLKYTSTCSTVKPPHATAHLSAVTHLVPRHGALQSTNGKGRARWRGLNAS